MDFIRITVASLVGNGTDVRLGKLVYSDGVSTPQYKDSVFGNGQLAFLDSINEAYSVEECDQNGNIVAP